jgi:hypothetical protein
MDKRRQKRRYFRYNTLEHQINRYKFLSPRRPTEARLTRELRAAPGKSILVEPQLKPEGSDSKGNFRTKKLN